MDIKELREKINGIDNQLTELFLKRMELVRGVAEYKRDNNLPILDAAREQEILRDISKIQAGEFTGDLTAFFSKLLQISRGYQSRLFWGEDNSYMDELLQNISPAHEAGVVAYQGVKGSYGEQVFSELFPNAQAKECASFEEVLKSLTKDADYGVLPIENSSTGGISEVYDLLRKYGAYIVREHIIKVEQNLLGVPGARIQDIKEVYSHNEGLSQSRDFLAEHPLWKQIPYYNTAVSARYVAETGDPSKAAIASLRAAQQYGLDVLARGINFNKNNNTRFIVVSSRFEAAEDADKMSIYLSLSHTSGALAQMLDIFSEEGINLTKIESRPIYNKSWEYYFYIDFEGSIHEEHVKKALSRAEKQAEYFEVLGNYKSAVRG